MEIRLSDHFTYKKLLRFVLPSIAMMLVSTTYGIVDGLFVSNLVGKNAFAALNIVMPLLMGIGAFGYMFGSGGSALIAYILGIGEKEKASKIFSMLIVVLITIGVGLAVVAFIWMKPIARLLGASDLLLSDCVLYGRILLCAIPFYMLQDAFQSLLITAEKPKMGLVTSIIAGLTNIVLDFVLVYVFEFGLGGAALATAFSWGVGGLVPIAFFGKNKTTIYFTKPEFDWRALGKACANGSSEMLSNISTSIVAILYNYQLMKFTGENGVAAYGVIMYVNYAFLAFFLGYAISCGPVVGYQYGAGNKKELKNLLRKSILLNAIAGIVMVILAETLANSLAQIFVGYDAELCSLTVKAMKLYSISFVICGLNIFGSAFFTGLNDGIISAIISFMRTLVFQVFSVLLLPLIFGIDGIWLAVVVAEGLTLLITIGLFAANKKKYGY